MNRLESGDWSEEEIELDIEFVEEDERFWNPNLKEKRFWGRERPGTRHNYSIRGLG